VLGGAGGREGEAVNLTEGMLWIFSPEKFDSFGRVRTHDLGYQSTTVVTGASFKLSQFAQFKTANIKSEVMVIIGCTIQKEQNLTVYL
jgi:hypothetical protein